MRTVRRSGTRERALRRTPINPTQPSKTVSATQGRHINGAGIDLIAAICVLHITPEEFDEVGTEIGRALDHFGVPEREKQELLAAVVAHKGEVANP